MYYNEDLMAVDKIKLRLQLQPAVSVTSNRLELRTWGWNARFAELERG